MNLYFELQKSPVFTMEDAAKYYNNIESARSAVKRLIKKDMVKKIRKNLYTCVSGESGEPIADRFQIGSAISETACISHHTAAEYYGITDQVYYDVYVTSDTRFNTFEFEGYTYIPLKAKIDSGVVEIDYSGGIRITDLERTVVDCIKDMDKISGMEEVLAMIEMVENLDQEKLLLYMSEYDCQFLYQKAGYLLWNYRKKLGLDHTFFAICKSKIGKSSRYLSRDISSGKYNEEWNLVVDENMTWMKNGRVDYHDSI